MCIPHFSGRISLWRLDVLLMVWLNFMIVYFSFPEYFPVADGMYALLGRLDFMIVGLIFLDKFPWEYWLIVPTRLNLDLSSIVSSFQDASFF